MVNDTQTFFYCSSSNAMGFTSIFRTLKVRILKVLTLCQSAKVKQRYLLKCENEVNPVAWIPQATSTAQFQLVQCWWPRESMLWGSLHFRTLKVQILKVLTLCQSAKVKQCYLLTYVSHMSGTGR